ncbi:MAG TPA: hypothetical protein VGK29_26790 [Paludibaculum sp.]|jgi:hypothetical protein
MPTKTRRRFLLAVPATLPAAPAPPLGPPWYRRHLLIGGNSGGAAAVDEMMLESHNDAIYFLLAQPAVWPVGSCEGRRVRQGVTVELNRPGGKATGADYHVAFSYGSVQ